VPAGQIVLTTLLHLSYAAKIMRAGAGVVGTAGHIHPIHIQKTSFQQIKRLIYFLTRWTVIDWTTLKDQYDISTDIFVYY